MYHEILTNLTSRVSRNRDQLNLTTDRRDEDEMTVNNFSWKPHV